MCSPMGPGACSGDEEDEEGTLDLTWSHTNSSSATSSRESGDREAYLCMVSMSVVMYFRLASVRERPFCRFHASLCRGNQDKGRRVGWRNVNVPFLPRAVGVLGATFRALHYTIYITLHGLLVQPIELQSRGGRWFLRTGADLVHRVERMAEHSVCSPTPNQHVPFKHPLLAALEDVPTESDITTLDYAPCHSAQFIQRRHRHNDQVNSGKYEVVRSGSQCGRRA